MTNALIAAVLALLLQANQPGVPANLQAQALSVATATLSLLTPTQDGVSPEIGGVNALATTTENIQATTTVATSTEPIKTLSDYCNPTHTTCVF